MKVQLKFYVTPVINRMLFVENGPFKGFHNFNLF